MSIIIIYIILPCLYKLITEVSIGGKKVSTKIMAIYMIKRAKFDLFLLI